MTYVRAFDAIEDGASRYAGGKGASLANLRRMGFSVPDGFVLLSTAFDEVLALAGIQNEIVTIFRAINPSDRISVDSSAERIQKLILNAKVPSQIVDELYEYFDAFDVEYVAVRSSATLEDSQTEAWAGQLDSFLNTNKSMLLSNVMNCWASLYSPRAVKYRFEANLQTKDMSVAVVVQKMVDSEASGVSFSIHPNRPQKNELLIEACHGLGEALVLGQITPSSYVLDKYSLDIIERHDEIQPRTLRAAVGTSGTRWHDFIKHFAAPPLSDSEIVDLAELTLRIERQLGYACDIEWTRYKGAFSVVQARPITAVAHLSKAKPRFVKTFARDFALVSLEIAYRCEASQTKKWMPGRKNPNSPYLVFERTDGTVYVWYNADGLTWIRKLLIAKAKSDPSFLEEIKQNVLTGIAWIRQHYEHPQALSAAQLQRFVNEYMQTYDWLEALWALCKIPDDELGTRNVLRDVRENTDKLSSGADAVVRHSLRNLYPEFGELSAMISLDELQSDLSPDKNTLHSRFARFVYIGGAIYPGLSRVEAAIAFNIEFNVDPLPDDKSTIVGMTGSPGKVIGVVCKVMGHGDFGKIRAGEILVSPMTMPDFVREMDKAAGVVTDEGGATCHAVIIARENNKPCVVGTGFATQLLADGDLIEVDADRGVVRLVRKGKT
jgi:phosphoenolpyruvate synthase/pyruvate phosphate dikinase